MMTGILHLHSFLRYVVLGLMLITLIDSLIRMYKPFNETDKKLALFTMISLHFQLVVGLILYVPMLMGYMDIPELQIMKDPTARFYVVEHMSIMILAIAIATIGYSRAKRQSEKWAKHRMIFAYYLVALLLILISIPWPFREVGTGRGWF